MNKAISALLAASLVICLGGCTKTHSSTEDSSDDRAQSAAVTNNEEAAQPVQETLDSTGTRGAATFSYPSSWFITVDSDEQFQVRPSDSGATAMLRLNYLEANATEADLLAFAEGVGNSESVSGGTQNITKCTLDGLSGVTYDCDLIVSDSTFHCKGITVSSEKTLYTLMVGFSDNRYEIITTEIFESLKIDKTAEQNDEVSGNAQEAQGAQTSSETPEQSQATPEEESKAETEKPTTEQSNALRTAENYLDTMPFSKKGLIKQLKFEGYSDEAANWAADHCGADWMKQAEKAAESYLDLMGFSRSELIKQLEFEGYTSKQAAHGADSVGL